MKKPNAKKGKTANPKTEQPMTNKTEQATAGTAEKAPKIRFPKWLRIWIKESQFVATTLSIILTFGTANVVDR